MYCMCYSQSTNAYIQSARAVREQEQEAKV